MDNSRDDALNAAAREIASDLARLTRKHTVDVVMQAAVPYSKWLLLAAGGLLGALIANLDAVLALAGRGPTVAATALAVVSAALGGLVSRLSMKLAVQAGTLGAEDRVQEELLEQIGKHLAPIPEMTTEELKAVSDRALAKLGEAPVLLRPEQESTALKALQKRLRLMGKLLDYQFWVLLLSATVVSVAALWV